MRIFFKDYSSNLHEKNRFDRTGGLGKVGWGIDRVHLQSEGKYFKDKKMMALTLPLIRR